MALHNSEKTRGDAMTLVAVVVTYNRPNLLAKTLEGINNGDFLPTRLVVVDNGSTDNSVEVIRSFLKSRLRDGIEAEIVELPCNTGGAGGFTIGIDRAAFGYNADLIWVMDDDTEPLQDSLHHLVSAWQSYSPELDFNPAFVASKVVWSDGRVHPMNTPRRRPYAGKKEIRHARKINCMTVRSASFVSLLLDGHAVRERGLPVADYFLWNDDFEYSARLARFGVGLYAPRSVVRHHTEKFDSMVKDPGGRFEWEIRNKIWMFRYSEALNPQEKILYGGASLIRWIKTLACGKDRKLLLRALGRGLRAGIFSAPRPNGVVLDGVYDLESSKLRPSQAGGRIRENRTELQNCGGKEEKTDFSILFPYYENDTVEKMRQALDSVTVDQSVLPAEIVLVQDGKVASSVEHFVKRYRKDLKIPVKVVVLKKNQGLAKALDAGLRKASYEFVARMDSDDISVPQRFEKQLELIAEGYDLVGSDVTEFTTDPQGRSIDIAVRRMPIGHDEIAKMSHFKSPFNHPTVMYRKSAVEKAGGYKSLAMMEDYWLFTRMIASGANMTNIPEPLVRYRVDDGAYARRGGLWMLASEVRLQFKLLAEGYNTFWVFLRNIVVRGGYRVIPEHLRKRLYARFFTDPKY